MMMKAILAAGAVALATAASAATTPAVYPTDLDDLAVTPISMGGSLVDVNSGFGFTDALSGGSVAYSVTVAFELMGDSSTIIDDVSFGVGTGKDLYDIAGGAVTGVPFSFLETFTVAAGDELFVNFALNNIKGAQYSYNLSATPAPIPLPAALPLMAAGLAALGFAARRRKA